MNIKMAKELNILLLGQTGVGKSTMINFLVNLCTYSSFDDALGKPVKFVIPTSFKVYPKGIKGHEIKLGDPDENEDLTKLTQSHTQKPKIYKISHSDFILNIIDVPGIGDTRGTLIDEYNTKIILDTVALFEKLHGICILLHSDRDKLDLMYIYCMNELLLHLHNEAAPNILFIFTHATRCDFTPGDANEVLTDYLKELKDKKGIVINNEEENLFSIDSESFRYLAAYNQVPEYQNMESNQYRSSWEQSLKAFQAIYKRIISVNPHSVINTLSINEARAMIISLMGPLATVTALIEDNYAHYEQNIDDIIKKLTNNLLITDYTIELNKLDYPKTVCTAKKCISVEKSTDGNFVTFYKQICHARCYLKNVPLEHFPEPALKDCAAMRRE
ncbi:hypothetical protein FO519_009361, partial [Halicephalobus sp. NKZ332]